MKSESELEMIVRDMIANCDKNFNPNGLTVEDLLYSQDAMGYDGQNEDELYSEKEFEDELFFQLEKYPPTRKVIVEKYKSVTH